MFSGSKDANSSKKCFIDQAQNARQIRAEEKRRDNAAIKIQVPR